MPCAGARARRRGLAGHRGDAAHGRGDRSDQGDRCPSFRLRRRRRHRGQISDIADAVGAERNIRQPRNAGRARHFAGFSTDSCIPAAPPYPSHGARRARLQVLKFFPAEASGGLACSTRSRRRSDLRFCRTGGIGAKNAAAISLPERSCGRRLLGRAEDAIAAGDFARVTALSCDGRSVAPVTGIAPMRADGLNAARAWLRMPAR